MNDQNEAPKTNESWDERYRTGRCVSREPHALLASLVAELPAGKALDLACGAGRHAMTLAAAGWQVTAVDSSRAGLEIAARRAAEENLIVDFRRADLERGEFSIAEDAYDLICDFFYLQRDLFPAIKKGVRAGGLVAAAIHFHGDGERAGRFTLREGELKEIFADFEILHYRETPPGETAAGASVRRTAEIVAQKKPIDAKARATAGEIHFPVIY